MSDSGDVYPMDAMAYRIAELEQELAEAREQLPEEMQDCTIEFISCPVGHGRLIATNWLDTGCQTCKNQKLHDALVLIGSATCDADVLQQIARNALESEDDSDE